MANPTDNLRTDFIQAFLEKAEESRTLSFREYVDMALYHPRCGYYTAKRERIGRSSERDFYTASSLGSVFGELVAEAARTLLPDVPLDTVSFVELGAEDGRSILDGVPEEHAPFAERIALGCRDELIIPPVSVVFANELLDAQPFHRIRKCEGKWREIGVELTPENTLREAVLNNTCDILATYSDMLPSTLPEGYTVDMPVDAVALLDGLLRQPWSGLLLLFDYGKPLEELLTHAPEGTGRAYYRQQLVNDLLVRPGEQDITCHVCWDWLEAVLEDHGFIETQLERQESFLVNHAEARLRAICESPDVMADRRRAVMELVHPSHMGASFQVLHGRRI